MFAKFLTTMGRRRRQRAQRHGAAAEEALQSASTLGDMRLGTSCRILRLHGGGAVRQRLLDMGFVPGTEVIVIRNAPLRDPIEVRLGDSFVTVRREEAARIEVSHV